MEKAEYLGSYLGENLFRDDVYKFSPKWFEMQYKYLEGEALVRRNREIMFEISQIKNGEKELFIDPALLSYSYEQKD